MLSLVWYTKNQRTLSARDTRGLVFYAHVPTCGPLMRDTRKATSPMIEIAAN